MIALTDAKIRFSDAVKAVEITPKTLRGWMAHPDFRLFSETPPHGWTAFTAADIALLAIMRSMIEHGVGIGAASRIARAILEARLGSLVRYRNTPAHVVESVFLDHHLIVWRVADDWVFDLFHDDDDDPDERAFLAIDLAPIVARAINRALENEGAS